MNPGPFIKPVRDSSLRRECNVKVIRMQWNDTMDATFRGIINRVRVSTEIMTRDADNRTKAEIARIFEDMLVVFDHFERAKGEIPTLGVKFPDLKNTALTAKANGIASQAIQQAEAARDRAASTTDALEKRLQAAIQSKLPGGDASAVQLQLLNLKNDLKMVFDSIHEAALVDAMVDELKNAIVKGDALTTYLLGSDPWPDRYLKSRGQDAYALLFHQRGVTEMAPLQSEMVQAQARVLNWIQADGQHDGLKVILWNLDNMYLKTATTELKDFAARCYPANSFN